MCLTYGGNSGQVLAALTAISALSSVDFRGRHSISEYMFALIALVPTSDRRLLGTYHLLRAAREAFLLAGF